MKPFLVCLVVILFCSCQKNPATEAPADTPNQQEKNAGMLYFRSESGLYAYDLDKDTIAWKAPAFLLDNNAMIYEDGFIYTGSVYGVTAINAKTGQVKWSTGFERGLSHAQSSFSPFNQPVVTDSLVYMIGYYNSSENAGLFCINKETGAVTWERDLSQGLDSKAWVYSTPVVMGDKIIALNHGNYDLNHIHCLNRFTGEVLWRNDDMASDLLWDNPIALNQTTVLFGSRSSTLYTLNVADGRISGLMSTSPERLVVNMKLLLQDKTIYAGTEGGIKSINPENGAVLKFYADTINNYLITPASIYVHKQYGVIQSRSLKDYAVKWSWSSPIQHAIDSAAAVRFLYTHAYTSFLVSDDETVYCYQFMPGEGSQPLINGFYLLNAQTGALIKEIKLPKLGYAVGRNLLVVKNGKGYRSMSIYVQ